MQPEENLSQPDLNRLRWKCRRGMLELDLLLAQFLASGIDQLTDEQLHAFSQLLDLEDQELWQMLRRESGESMSVLAVLMPASQ